MEVMELNARIVESIMIASETPVTQSRLNSCLEGGHKIDLEETAEYLNHFYEKHGLSFFIRKVAGGYLIVTKKDYEPYIRRYINRSGRIRLSYAALETLAIIAYKQPVGRPDIEAVRGVNSDGVISTLIERELITVKGRAETPGRPLLYGVTDEFLRYFGLNSTSDLPRLKELKEILESHQQTGTETETAPEIPESFLNGESGVPDTETIPETQNETE